MGDYRSKLRSAKTSASTEPEETIKEEPNNEPDIPESPQTPPHQSIESYFPPSPFGRKRFQPQGDRLIPSRDRARDFQISTSIKPTTEGSETPSKRQVAYIRAEVFDDETAVEEYIHSDRSTRRALLFTPTRYSPESSIPPNLSPSPTLNTLNDSAVVDFPNAKKYQTSRIGENGRRLLASSDKYSRQINTTPIKILDAPELQDDFYLNLVDWGPNNCLAVGLGSCVYLWNANTSRVTKLCDFVTETVTSVNWAHHGSLLAVGINTGRAYLYDTDAQKRIRTWSSHSSRIGALAWKSNILSTAGRDHAIYHHDVRSPEDYFRKLTGHTQEVCGLKWNTEGTMLASGGNDNNLFVWDNHADSVLHRFTQHIAAVKAIGWSPHRRGVLVSGGGTADKTIKFWNTINGSLTSSHDTGSQVCNIVWSKRTDDIISSHGYASNSSTLSNQVMVWRADNMNRVATLSGHTCRVLYMAMSNDGSTVVTGAGDETLRFWHLFNSNDFRNDSAGRQTSLR